MKWRTDVCIYECKLIYLFRFISPSFEREMLIMYRSDPSRCVDCCFHLYLLFFLKKTWTVVRTFEFSLCFDHANSLWWLCSVMMLGDGRDCVYEVIPFPEDYLRICQRGEERKGEETKGCFSFRDKTLCRWTWHRRFKPDYTAINVLCVCPESLMSRVLSLRTQQCVIVSAIWLDSSASLSFN